MAWILLEGLDRSGKSTIAELYKKKGFEVVHMEAPNKKFSQPGYAGPSYLEEMVNIYNMYSGKDVIFDRTSYGETIWPDIFNRQPQLNAEDLEYLERLEYNNDAVKYLMWDENIEAHWQRCTDNKEPLNRLQFVQAARLYDELVTKFNFEKKQLGDFDLTDSTSSTEELSDKIETNGDASVSEDIRQSGESIDTKLRCVLTLEERLERANAIRSLLKSPLIKKKGEIFAELESNIKEFLEQELEDIFSEPKKEDFTKDEVQILKIYAQRIKEKMR